MRRLGWLFVLALAASGGAPAAETESGLPWMKEWGSGHELPPPIGLSVLYYTQNHDYDMDRLSAFPQVPPGVPAPDLAAGLDTSAIGVENDVDQIGLKADAWLLPFLNAFALVGQIDGTTEVAFGNSPAALAFGTDRLKRDYDGTVYGGGATLAAGWDDYFVSMQGVWTKTDLDAGTSVSTTVFRPIVGYRLRAVTAWAGAMWQDTQEEHEGVFPIPALGLVRYDLTLNEKDPWNALTGVRYQLNEHWFAQAEVGFGSRTHIELELTYRF